MRPAAALPPWAARRGGRPGGAATCAGRRVVEQASRPARATRRREPRAVPAFPLRTVLRAGRPGGAATRAPRPVLVRTDRSRARCGVRSRTVPRAGRWMPCGTATCPGRTAVEQVYRLGGARAVAALLLGAA
ncbi:hypothetical protein KCH_61850 [Kitasatospora cheerisanensis KCTC 2395]|uniref:Uncharacterized protein n=1 Tax=Kitasatospora cheerisanensis KCTC 2395 TaxID=1348663 RepID=A0A066YVB3_9ACTN|nr:hypothetical protein KCH_61850 [Kitasatospora cheerisanensis KCTC 2395]